MARNLPPAEPMLLDARGPRATILVVEDDPAVAFMLTDLLEAAGYQVREARTGAAARALAEQLQPDLITLDLVLPDEDGLVLCSLLKPISGDAPILVCSGTQRRRDDVLSRKLGADDFIAKPFDVYDLLARVEVLLRRRAAQMAEPTQLRTPIRIGELVIDHSLHQVSLADRGLQLTPTEYRLLSVLASRPDQVVPRETLAKLVWGDPDAGTSRTIDVHIGRLRLKLSHAGRLPGARAPQIVSVRGFGYKLISGQRLAADLAADPDPDADRVGNGTSS